MRRLVVLVGIFVLALPVAASADKRVPGDGTLAVENAMGSVTLLVRGGIIGRFDSGSITIADQTPGTGLKPVVVGYVKSGEVPGTNQVRYSSPNNEVRFRLIGGLHRVTITGIGIDVSVAGRGTVVLDGRGFTDFQTGRYSLNGAPWQAMPGVRTTVALGTLAGAGTLSTSR